MLSFIRERAQGWVAWVIVGLLIIPFALWGINEYLGNGGRLAVADVNGTEISQGEFQQAFYEQRGRMQQMFGEQYDARLLDPQIKQRTINLLIDRELLLQYANEMGYRVSDKTVVATIQSIDAFREDGAFSTGLYQQQVQAQGQSPAAFEQRVKRLMATSQLPDGLAATVLVTDAELDKAIKLQEQTRDFQYLILPTSKYQDESVANEAAIKAYYEQHLKWFMTTEKVSVEYVELSAAALAPDEEPNEEKLRELYDSNSSQFQVPEERQASHILIQLEDGVDEAAVNAARDKANDLVAKIKSGESFEDLAKTNSDDPGSAELGGDLGYFGRGVMEPDFEQAVFALNEGGISEPVLTSFGFHIIKLTGVRAEASKPFEEVREELLKQFQLDVAERQYFDLTEKLTNLAYESPDSLSEIADQLGLAIKQSPLFGRTGGADIFANKQTVAAAYSNDVLKQGFNSEPIEIGANHVVVLRMLEHQEAKQRPLEDVQAQVKTQLIREKAIESTKAAGEALIKQLETGEDSKAAAQSLALEWKVAKAVKRTAEKMDAAVVNQAFGLKRPAEDSVSFGGGAFASGNYVIIQLDKVADGNPATFEKSERETLKRRMADALGNDAQTYLIETLKSQASIIVQKDEL
jgi:peptidyl-prolyl cis-trans isomerase D